MSHDERVQVIRERLETESAGSAGHIAHATNDLRYLLALVEAQGRALTQIEERACDDIKHWRLMRERWKEDPKEERSYLKACGRVYQAEEMERFVRGVAAEVEAIK